MKESKEDKKLVIATDTDLFGEHITKVSKGRKKDTSEVVPENEDLTIYGVSLNPLHLACVDDELRPNTRLIEIKNNVASATNGHVLVKIDLSLVSPFTPEQRKILNGKYIHMKVWEEMSSCDSLSLDEDEIVCNKDGINRIFEYSLAQGEFFKVDHVVDEIKRIGEEPKRIIKYNTKMIALISKIFKCDNLFFSFSKGNAGTIIYEYEDSGMFAVLMPTSIDGAPNRYFFN